MLNDNFPKTPFVNRKMLAFEHGTVFEIQIVTSSRTAGTISIRGATSEGQFTYKHTTTGSFTKKTEKFRITDLPIWLTVVDSGSAFNQGELFAIVTLVVNGTEAQQMVAGYLSKDQGISWPSSNLAKSSPTQGRFRTIDITDPGLGAEVSHTVPAGTILKVRAFRAQFLASAVAATRTPHIFVYDGPTQIYTFIGTTSFIANDVRLLHAYPAVTNGEIAAQNINVISIPADLLLLPGFKIQTFTQNIQGGDEWDVPKLLVEEFIDI